MLKIITKSAHNALFYQIEDLKKKLESANENIETYKEDLEQLEKGILSISGKFGEANGQKEQIRIELLTAKRNMNLYATRHRSCVLKNESLTAENHRLGNLLQVKCDEVKALEKQVKEVEKAESLSTEIVGHMEVHILKAISIMDKNHSKLPIKKALQEALKPLQEIN